MDKTEVLIKTVTKIKHKETLQENLLHVTSFPVRPLFLCNIEDPNLMRFFIVSIIVIQYFNPPPTPIACVLKLLHMTF